MQMFDRVDLQCDIEIWHFRFAKKRVQVLVGITVFSISAHEGNMRLGDTMMTTLIVVSTASHFVKQLRVILYVWVSFFSLQLVVEVALFLH